MFLLELPNRGDSNEYTRHTIFNTTKIIALNYPKCSYVIFSKGLKNEFETAVVNEPSVFELLKFHCKKKLEFSFLIYRSEIIFFRSMIFTVISW